ncbi:hypothetical protein U1Q18_005215 [Sarracenia purpurea var. burkii]
MFHYCLYSNDSSTRIVRCEYGDSSPSLLSSSYPSRRSNDKNGRGVRVTVISVDLWESEEGRVGGGGGDCAGGWSSSSVVAGRILDWEGSQREDARVAEAVSSTRGQISFEGKKEEGRVGGGGGDCAGATLVLPMGGS